MLQVFTVKIRPGWRDGHAIRFGAMGTNNLQSVGSLHVFQQI